MLWLCTVPGEWWVSCQCPGSCTQVSYKTLYQHVMTTALMTSGLEEGQRGIFWDGHTSHPWLVLGHQLLGILAISAWSMAWSALVFGILK